jgi:protein gp37
MSDKTKKGTGISFLDESAGFWWGCQERSPGCLNCFARNLPFARVMRKKGIELWGPNGVRIFHEQAIADCLRWNKKPWVCNECAKATCVRPEETASSRHSGGLCGYCGKSGFHRRRVGINFASDWLEGNPKGWRVVCLGCGFSAPDTKGSLQTCLHCATPLQRLPVGGIPVEWLARLLDTVRQCPDLTFLVFTKRPENWKARLDQCVARAWNTIGGQKLFDFCASWAEGGVPPPNLWIYASIEGPGQLSRIDDLRKIPAVVHGLSIEPLLDPIPNLNLEGISHVIVGGESGHKHGKQCYDPTSFALTCTRSERRDCGVEAITNVADQCKAAGVPCYVKQASALKPGQQGAIPDEYWKIKEFPNV